MASIIENLQAILSARYGRDVRNAIHDSISDLNEIANTAQTSAKAYYEGTQALAQTVSGNVGIDDSTATLGTTYSSHKIEDKTRTNLLNPTLGTTTINGVTCTNNGDGTYTLNGTATNDQIFFRVTPWGGDNYNSEIELETGKTYKVVGCPNGGGSSTYRVTITRSSRDNVGRSAVAHDYGDGKTFVAEEGYRYECYIHPSINTPINNLVFKPMLTTDLSATYDDFVQYSGSGELNQNVAEMYKEIQAIKDAITELGGTV